MQVQLASKLARLLAHKQASRTAGKQSTPASKQATSSYELICRQQRERKASKQASNAHKRKQKQAHNQGTEARSSQTSTWGSTQLSYVSYEVRSKAQVNSSATKKKPDKYQVK